MSGDVMERLAGIQRLQAAIAALAGNRLEEAAVIVRQLLEEPRPIQPGVCRYCGCSEANGCGVLVEPGLAMEPIVATCAWVDAECTVCSNVRCLDRWRREQPITVGMLAPDRRATPAGIVLP